MSSISSLGRCLLNVFICLSIRTYSLFFFDVGLSSWRFSGVNIDLIVGHELLLTRPFMITIDVLSDLESLIVEGVIWLSGDFDPLVSAYVIAVSEPSLFLVIFRLTTETLGEFNATNPFTVLLRLSTVSGFDLLPQHKESMLNLFDSMRFDPRVPFCGVLGTLTIGCWLSISS